MEIERKFLIKRIPHSLDSYSYYDIEQGYLSTNPVIRIRKQDDDYILTYKGNGLMCREEYNLPLTKEAYHHLLTKTDDNFISKRRYLIPLENNLTIELDIFKNQLEGLMIAEVEFDSEQAAMDFYPPDWLGTDVTFSKIYHNSNLKHLNSIEELNSSLHEV